MTRLLGPRPTSTNKHSAEEEVLKCSENKERISFWKLTVLDKSRNMEVMKSIMASEARWTVVKSVA